MSKRYLIFVIILLFFSSFISAQVEVGTIVYAEGTSFSIVRGSNTPVYYDIDSNNVIDLVLYEGDIIHTERDTFIEIEFEISKSLIKIAENSSVSLSRITANGGGVINLEYGRIRAKVNQVTSDETFWITANNSVAGIESGDFGVDLLLTGDSDIVDEEVTVYSFSGNVNLLQSSENDPDRKMMFSMNDANSIDSDEMISSVELKDEKLSDEIFNYWNENDFASEFADAPDLIVLESDGNNMIFRGEIDPVRTAQHRKTLKTTSAVSFAVGILCMGGGLTAYIIAPETEWDTYLMLTGGGISLMGVTTAILANTVNIREKTESQ